MDCCQVLRDIRDDRERELEKRRIAHSAVSAPFMVVGNSKQSIEPPPTLGVFIEPSLFLSEEIHDLLIIDLPRKIIATSDCETPPKSHLDGLKKVLPEARQVTGYDEQGSEIYGEAIAVPDEDLLGTLPNDLLDESLARLNLKPSSRKVYRSRKKNLIRRLVTKEPGYPKKKCNCLSNKSLAALFDHLEQRCLNRHFKEPLQPYRDLLEMRFLFYVPIPSTKLAKATIADIAPIDGSENHKTQVFKNDGDLYPIPNSFIRLARSILSEKEPILKKGVKERNRFVENIARAAKINVKISSKLIQQAGERIIRL